MSAIRNLLSSATLATLVACGGISGQYPQPKPTLNLTVSFKTKNLDNPGSTEYMSGDRIEYTVNAVVSVSNPTTNMEPASILCVEYTMYPGQGFNMVLYGNNLTDFNDTRVNTVEVTDVTTTAALQYRITVNDPTVPSKSTTLTGNGNTVTFKPAEQLNYTTAINPNIAANITEISTIASRFRNTQNNQQLTADQWKAIYFAGMDNLGAETISYDVDFQQNTMRLYASDGFSLAFATINRKDVYDLKKAYTKTP